MEYLDAVTVLECRRDREDRDRLIEQGVDFGLIGFLVETEPGVLRQTPMALLELQCLIERRHGALPDVIEVRLLAFEQTARIAQCLIGQIARLPPPVGGLFARLRPEVGTRPGRSGIRRLSAGPWGQDQKTERQSAK